MQAQVKAWGNSQGIRISKEILQEANIAIDDVLNVKVANGVNLRPYCNNQVLNATFTFFEVVNATTKE